MRIHLIHGIRTQGTSPIQRLGSYLTGFQTLYPDYGWIFGLETRVVNPVIVGTLKPYVEPGDLMIGHSNGCAVIYDLINSGVELTGAVFINAALKQDIERPSTVPWIDVYFNSGDLITEAAELGAKLGIDDPVWGEMGHGGYRGVDDKITNFDCGRYSGLPVVQGHSDFFAPEKLQSWGPFLAARLRSRLGIAVGL